MSIRWSASGKSNPGRRPGTRIRAPRPSPVCEQGGSSTATRGKRAGFTLIELLVVIVLIALLTALVVPAVRSSLERGRISHCMSNQRQLASGILLTAVDGYRTLPPGTLIPYSGTFLINGQTWNFTWFGALAGELGLSNRLGPPDDANDLSAEKPDVFRCPSAGPSSGWTQANLSYSVETLRVFQTLKGTAPDHVVRDSLSYLTRVRHPAKTGMLCDSDGNGTMDDLVRVIRYPPPRADLFRPGDRHRDGGVAAFADGHAVWLPYEELGGREGPFGPEWVK